MPMAMRMWAWRGVGHLWGMQPLHSDVAEITIKRALRIKKSYDISAVNYREFGTVYSVTDVRGFSRCFLIV